MNVNGKKEKELKGNCFIQMETYSQELGLAIAQYFKNIVGRVY